MPILNTHDRTTGSTKNEKFQPMGRTPALFGVFVGFVKRADDVQRNGRLMVWIPEFGSAPDNEDGWTGVNYCSPFAGATNVNTTSKSNIESFEGTQTSYGMWMIPPDINNQVIVMFLNGDPSKGIWIGSLFQQYMNNMVPAIASDVKNYQYPGKNIPIAEYNKWDTSVTYPDRAIKPYEKTKFMGVGNQGLINDKSRGVTTSGARRESPSNVFGIITPGPAIDPNATPAQIRRKGGSSFVMDDGDGTEYIQLTTKTGAQIRIDETNGFVYLINRDGTAWVHMDQKGNVDIFGALNVSMRAQRDFNIRADRNINIEAGQNIFMKAAKDTTESNTSFTYDVNNKPQPSTIPVWEYVGEGKGEGGNIVMQALNNWQSTTQKTAYLTVRENNMNIKIGDSLNLTTERGGQDYNSKTGIKMTTDAAMDFVAAGNIRASSDGIISVVGVKDIILCTSASMNIKAADSIQIAAVNDILMEATNLGVTVNEALFSNNVGIDGNTNIGGDTNIVGGLTVGQSADIVGNTHTGGNLDVNGGADIGGNTGVGGNLDAGGSVGAVVGINSGGDVTALGGVSAAGEGDFSGGINVGGGANIVGGVRAGGSGEFQGSGSFGGGLSVCGGGTFGGNLAAANFPMTLGKDAGGNTVLLPPKNPPHVSPPPPPGAGPTPPTISPQLPSPPPPPPLSKSGPAIPTEATPAQSELARGAAIAAPAEVKPLNQKLNILATWKSTLVYPDWQPNTSYAPGKVVVYNKILYIAKNAVPASVSFNSILWETFSPDDKFKRNSEFLQTTVSKFPTYEPCPEHESFNVSNVAGAIPIITPDDSTYSGSAAAGNTTTTPPASAVNPGADNTSVQGDPPSDSTNTANMNMNAFRCQLIIHEGLKKVSYSDTKGLTTGGIGHLMRSNEISLYPVGTPLPDTQVETWYGQDSLSAVKIAQDLIGDIWSTYSDIRKRAVADLAYNLGKGGLAKFIRFIEAMKASKFDVAGQELTNSAWFSQVGKRGPNIVSMITNNIDPNGCDRRFPS